MSRGLSTPQLPFNPYYQWLGIPLRDQPPHHYRLLGIALFEADGQIIRAAADRRLMFIRKYQLGQHSAWSQQLLDQVAEARSCLLDPESRRPYEERLDARLGGRGRLTRPVLNSPGGNGATDDAGGSNAFDPYYAWLGIRHEDQPHHHYQLLGLERFETDPHIIRVAAEQQLTYVNKYSTGRFAEQSRQLIDELREAQGCLLSPAMKAGYDEGLRASLRGSAEAPPVASVATLSSAPLSNTVSNSVSKSFSKTVAAETVRPGRTWKLVRWLSTHGKAIGYTAASALVAAGVLLVVMLSAPDPNFTVEDRFPAPRPVPAPGVARQELAANTVPPSARIIGVRHVDSVSGSTGVPAVATPASDSAATGAEHVARTVETASRAVEMEPVPEHTPEQPAPASDDAGKPAGEQATTNTASDVTASPAEMPEKSAPPVTGPQTADSAAARQLKPGMPVNLLQQIDLKRDMIAGKWKFDKGVLVSPLNAFHARVQIPTSVPAAYTVQAVVERSRGSSRVANRTLAFGLVIGEAQYLVTIDGSTAAGMQFQEGKPSVILCTVRPEGVRVTFDGRKVVEWSGDAQRLTIPPLWETPDTQSLFIGSDCGYRFRSLILRPLE